VPKDGDGMMTDGDLASQNPSGGPAGESGTMPGRTAMDEFLRGHDAVAPRGALARLFGASPLTAETRPLFNAAVGEIEVGDDLDALGDGWRVVHAVPVGADNTDIDHLVVGPGGVFIINTKYYSGLNVWVSQRTFVVAGIRYPHVRNMEYEMGRVERLLATAVGRPVEVSGVLAVVNPRTLTVRQQHRDVAVVPSADLPGWLKAHRQRLGCAEVENIAAAARLDSTWHEGTHVRATAADVRARFDEVRAGVRSAWRLQVFWATIITAVGAGGFVVLTYAIFLNAL